MATDEVLDARGLKCPLPVLRTEKRLVQLPAGARLTVLASDPMAKIDIPLHCRRHGHACEVSQEGETLRFSIMKAS